MNIKQIEQTLLPFPKRETFFGGKVPIQIKIEFPFSPKNLSGITEQIILFEDELQYIEKLPASGKRAGEYE